MKKCGKRIIKFTAVTGSLLAGTSWVMFSHFLKRKDGVDYKLETERDLINPALVKDEFKLQDMEGLKWERAHQDIYEKVTLTSGDGLKLVGHYFDQGAKKTALMVHGITSWHGSRLAAGRMYFEEGYNILAIDQRMYGESEGTYCTMGRKESDDVIQWAHFLAEEKAQEKILMDGVSMGSATVLVCSGREDLPEEVIGIVADCGFTSTKDMMEWQVKNGYNLPTTFPFLNIVEMYCKRFAEFDPEDMTPIQMVAKSKVPILFVHGTADTFVPYYMVDELYQACRSEKYILRVKDAPHALSYWQKPEEYREAVKAFLQKVKG